MKFLYSLLHFLGSITFAIILITLTAAFVIAGTFLESLTDSHRQAEKLIYGSYFFQLLLWGFFFNILVSALRRWPFRSKHIPFLITHFGLLMILGGALLKSYVGMQGGMSISEGKASQRVFLADTYALYLEARDPLQTVAYQIPFSKDLSKLSLRNSDEFFGLRIQLLNAYSHSTELQETWITEDQGRISGHPPFPLGSKPIQIKIQGFDWNVVALRDEDPVEAAKNLYLDHLNLRIKDISTNKTLYDGPYAPSIRFDTATAKCRMDFSFSPISGLDAPQFNIDFEDEQGIVIPLSGPESLLNIKKENSYFGANAKSVDLTQRPMIALIQDFHDDLYFFVFDPWGHIYEESFRKDNLQTLLIYDNGFGGYAVQAHLPFPSMGREVKEKAQLHFLGNQLRKHVEANSEILSPPLQLLKKACEQENIDFVDTCTNFLWKWNIGQKWIYSEGADSKALASIDWNSIPKNDFKACCWISSLMPELENEVGNGKDLMKTLKERGWPFAFKHLRSSKPSETFAIFTGLTQQIYEAAAHLPPLPIAEWHPAELLSAYLRIYGIHYQSISQPPSTLEDAEEQIRKYAESIGLTLPWVSTPLETPLTYRYLEDLSYSKLENNIPTVTLELLWKGQKETITLAYNRLGNGLALPVLNGNFLLRFQPQIRTIPYRIRLRNARQISYPNSEQPYSYESDLIITDRSTGSLVEKTISMNNVHETWDGYRFYLANISPSTENAVRHIQLVVSHDPGKYFITYPGAIILVLGIFLLFWIKPYKRSS